LIEQILHIALVLKSNNGMIDGFSKQLESAQEKTVVLKKENAVFKRSFSGLRKAKRWPQ